MTNSWVDSEGNTYSMDTKNYGKWMKLSTDEPVVFHFSFFLYPLAIVIPDSEQSLEEGKYFIFFVNHFIISNKQEFVCLYSC